MTITTGPTHAGTSAAHPLLGDPTVVRLQVLLPSDADLALAQSVDRLGILLPGDATQRGTLVRLLFGLSMVLQARCAGLELDLTALPDDLLIEDGQVRVINQTRPLLELLKVICRTRSLTCEITEPEAYCFELEVCPP